jgi:DEAD/DEAH box helicase domain-containing protein
MLNQPKRTIVLDLETKKAFDGSDRSRLEGLGVSVVGIYRYDADRWETYDESQFALLSALLAQTELIVGFNVNRFDLPVLQPHVRVPLRKLRSLDLLEEMRRVLGHRVSLNAVARATLGRTKSGDGLQAVKLYQRGELDRLKRYCLDDVRLTREVYEHGCRHRQVVIPSRFGNEMLPVSVTWGDPPPETPELMQGSLF